MAKKKYHDAPRYPVIYQYEDEFKKNWSNMIKLGLKEFEVRLNQILKD